MNKLQKFNLSKECQDLVSGKRKKKKLSRAFRVEQNTAYLFVLILISNSASIHSMSPYLFFIQHLDQYIYHLQIIQHL